MAARPTAGPARPMPAPTRSWGPVTATTRPAGCENVTDPRGIVNFSDYDDLGRVTKTIEAYVDGIVSGNDDRTTEFTYDGNSNLTMIWAWSTDSVAQITQYVYGVTTAGGSAINSNDLLAEVRHPDPEHRRRQQHRRGGLHLQRPGPGHDLHRPQRQRAHLQLRRAGPADERRRHDAGQRRRWCGPPAGDELRHRWPGRQADQLRCRHGRQRRQPGPARVQRPGSAHRRNSRRTPAPSTPAPRPRCSTPTARWPAAPTTAGWSA